MLSFLRQEGEAYQPDHARAPASTRPSGPWRRSGRCGGGRSAPLPRCLRSRVVLRLARATIRHDLRGIARSVRLRKGEGTVDVRGSLFCDDPRVVARAALRLLRVRRVARSSSCYDVPAEVRLGAVPRGRRPQSACIGVSVGPARRPRPSDATRRRAPEDGHGPLLVPVCARAGMLACPGLGPAQPAATRACSSCRSRTSTARDVLLARRGCGDPAGRRTSRRSASGRISRDSG